MSNNLEINEFWTKRKIIPIFGVIDDDIACEIIKALYTIHFDYEETFVPREKRKVVLLINSPGGLVGAGFSIFDTIKSLPLSVYTVCIGVCASMGAFLLSSGDKGKRYAFENSEIMIHQPLGGAQGQASDIKIIADHIMKIKYRLNSILSNNTGKNYETIEKDSDRDNYLSADQALDYGLIDEIITPQKFLEVFKNEIT